MVTDTTVLKVMEAAFGPVWPADRIPDVRAALEAVEAAVWKPIETAPRDGTAVDLWAVPYNGTRRRMTNYWWVDGIGWRTESRKLDLDELGLTAVLWCPLPAPPTVTIPYIGGMVPDPSPAAPPEETPDAE